MAIRVFHRDKPTAIVPMIAKDARLIVWPGVEAYTANMNYVDMQPGERNVEHVHVESEDRGDHIESVGGPCPADWNMLRAAGLVPDEADGGGLPKRAAEE